MVAGVGNVGKCLGGKVRRCWGYRACVAATVRRVDGTRADPNSGSSGVDGMTEDGTKEDGVEDGMKEDGTKEYDGLKEYFGLLAEVPVCEGAGKKEDGGVKKPVVEGAIPGRCEGVVARYARFFPLLSWRSIKHRARSPRLFAQGVFAEQRIPGNHSSASPTPRMARKPEGSALYRLGRDSLSQDYRLRHQWVFEWGN